MSRLFSRCILLAAFFGVLCAPHSLRAADETITSFSTNLTLDRSGTLFVEERITYDFGATDRHGIIRSIPFRYAGPWGTVYNLDTTVHTVTRNNASTPFTRSRLNNNLLISIGDPEITHRGKHTYGLTYTVGRVTRTDGAMAEVYWNAIGSEWEVPITDARITVTLPRPIANEAQVSCTKGILNSTSTCGTITRTDNTFTITSDQPLQSAEAVTILIRFPRNALNEPSLLHTLRQFFRDNPLVLTPFGCALLCYILWLIWGKDARGRGTIITQYEPPAQCSPLEAGTMIDQHIDERDIAALFITWAQQGYIAISFDDRKQVRCTKLRLLASSTVPAEERLFSAMFAHGPTFELHTSETLHEALNAVKNETYQRLVRRGFFTVHPELIRSAFIAAGAIIGFGGGFLFSFIVYPGGLPGFLALVIMLLNGAIIGFTGRFMPQTTPEGALLVEHIEGFKRFLSVTEKERLAFFNAPEKKPEQFERFLPYAIALGVEKQWAAQFADMHLTPPNWYHNSSAVSFSSTSFAATLSQATHTLHTSLAHTPRSTTTSGGTHSGSAGNGFGGGGGRSW